IRQGAVEFVFSIGIRYWYSIRGRIETTSAQAVRASRRVPSGPLDRLVEALCANAVQALCFGDFHLGQQMKVTRPPRREPAAWGYSKAANQCRESRPTQYVGAGVMATLAPNRITARL